MSLIDESKKKAKGNSPTRSTVLMDDMQNVPGYGKLSASDRKRYAVDIQKGQALGDDEGTKSGLLSSDDNFLDKKLQNDEKWNLLKKAKSKIATLDQAKEDVNWSLLKKAKKAN